MVAVATAEKKVARLAAKESNAIFWIDVRLTCSAEIHRKPPHNNTSTDKLHGPPSQAKCMHRMKNNVIVVIEFDLTCLCFQIDKSKSGPLLRVEKME